MTDTDSMIFAQCFASLARAQGGPTDPDTVLAYFDALKDLPLEAVQAAATKLAREGEYFPRSGKWHEAGAIEARQFIERLRPLARAEPWHHECENCRDTGWMERWVEQGQPVFSQHERVTRPAMYRHQEAVACPCRPTNRTYQRKHLIVTDDTPVTDAQVKRIRKRAQGWKKPGA